MRELKLPKSGPKRKLLDKAESLFAVRGFDNVSVRDITRAAKANVAAVNYHFGSREELMTLVMIRRVVPLETGRSAALDELERQSAGMPVPVGGILRAFIFPLAEQARLSGIAGDRFFKLAGRIFARRADGLPEPVESRLSQTTDRFAAAFAKSLPGLAAGELAARMDFLAGALIQLLLQPGRGPIEAEMDRLVRFAAAGFADGVETAGFSTEPPQAPEIPTETPEADGPQAMFDF